MDLFIFANVRSTFEFFFPLLFCFYNTMKIKNALERVSLVKIQVGKMKMSNQNFPDRLGHCLALHIQFFAATKQQARHDTISVLMRLCLGKFPPRRCRFPAIGDMKKWTKCSCGKWKINQCCLHESQFRIWLNSLWQEN